MSNTFPLISIVIPCYNYGKYLSDAIESCLNQTYKNIEILVIDDGSKDNTKYVAKKYAKQVKYYFKNNGGDSSARNYSIKFIKGEYITFLDADNKLNRRFIELAYKELCKHREIAFVYTQLKNFGLENNNTKYNNYDFELLKYTNYIDACSLIRKKVFNKLTYDESFRVFQDWDFYLTLGEKGYKGILLNLPLVEYRKHGKSTIDEFKLTSMAKKRKAYIKIYLKHWRLYKLNFLARWIIGDIIISLFEYVKLNLFKKVS